MRTDTMGSRGSTQGKLIPRMHALSFIHDSRGYCLFNSFVGHPGQIVKAALCDPTTTMHGPEGVSTAWHTLADM